MAGQRKTSPFARAELALLRMEISSRTVLTPDGVAAHCCGRGGMFLLRWNTFSGSYFAFTSASRP